MAAERKTRCVSPSTHSGEAEGECAVFRQAGRSVYMNVDLDLVSSNITLIRSLCQNKNAGICAMVKGNGYGHGSILLSRHLKSIGVERLGVATIDEGMELRQAGVSGPIHLMGNVLDWEMEQCLDSQLIPTVTTVTGAQGMADAIRKKQKHFNDDKTSNTQITKKPCVSEMPPDGAIHIKVDSGMSRNGCQPDDLNNLVKVCEALDLPIEGIYTHLADFENEEFTKHQVDTFLSAVKPYRHRPMLFHISNSGAIITGVGTDLDLVRPGISMYGLPPGGNIESFRQMGFQPVACVKSNATLVKQLPRKRKVGYGGTYEVCMEQGEWIATLPFGYADGYFRSLSNTGIVIRNSTGERCALVGRVSMDAITVSVSTEPSMEETFTLITADFDPMTSATGIATQLDTINYEVTTRVAVRVPRYYQSHNKGTFIIKLGKFEYPLSR